MTQLQSIILCQLPSNTLSTISNLILKIKPPLPYDHPSTAFDPSTFPHTVSGTIHSNYSKPNLRKLYDQNLYNLFLKHQLVELFIFSIFFTAQQIHDRKTSLSTFHKRQDIQFVTNLAIFRFSLNSKYLRCSSTLKLDIGSVVSIILVRLASGS